jgi:replicative DNA helicase
MIGGRSLPADLNAERATLGAILLDRDAIIALAPWLPADSFYLEKHGWIYEAMLRCYQQRIPPDLTTVADDLRRHPVDVRGATGPMNRLEAVGGLSYLAELSVEVPTAVHVEYYGRIVERTAILRRLIEVGGQISALGYDEREDLDVTLGKAEAALFAIAQRRRNRTLRPILEVGTAYWQTVQAAVEGNLLGGVPTGYLDLDDLLGGLHPSDLVILAARPGVGKSALALNLLYNMAFAGRRIALFSLEMSEDQMYERLMAMHTGISTDVLRRKKDLSTAHLSAIADATGVITSQIIWIDDTAAIDVLEAQSKARQLHAQEPLDVIVVDYLQRMSVPAERDNRVQTVGKIVRTLKSMARELHVPVVALSQLTRAVEGRTNHIPTLADLRETGEIEQEADVVLMLYREELYDKETEKQGITEVHIAKHRHGPLGVVRLRFDARTTRFQNLERHRTLVGY